MSTESQKGRPTYPRKRFPEKVPGEGDRKRFPKREADISRLGAGVGVGMLRGTQQTNGKGQQLTEHNIN